MGLEFVCVFPERSDKLIFIPGRSIKPGTAEGPDRATEDSLEELLTE